MSRFAWKSRWSRQQAKNLRFAAEKERWTEAQLRCETYPISPPTHGVNDNVRKTGPWWDWYNAYLLSSWWDRKRRRKLKQTKYTCQRCGAKKCRLYVHHLTYERVGKERMEDLEVQCEPCHDNTHAPAAPVSICSLTQLTQDEAAVEWEQHMAEVAREELEREDEIEEYNQLIAEQEMEDIERQEMMDEAARIAEEEALEEVQRQEALDETACPLGPCARCAEIQDCANDYRPGETEAREAISDCLDSLEYIPQRKDGPLLQVVDEHFDVCQFKNLEELRAFLEDVGDRVWCAYAPRDSGDWVYEEPDWAAIVDEVIEQMVNRRRLGLAS